MRRWQRPVLAGCLVLLLFGSVSAVSVEKVSISPSGALYPGNPVNISCTVLVASGIAYPSYYDVQFISGLDDPSWTYAVVVNGITNDRPESRGRMLTISGYELKYQNDDEVEVTANLRGTVPADSALGMNRTLLTIQELDSRGYSISSSVISIDRLIGEPTPPPTPASGSLAVSSSPAGANLYLDNVYKGISPATLSGIPNGDHLLLIRMDGYQEYRKEITVTGDAQEVHADLQRGTAPGPSVSSEQTTAPAGGASTPATTAPSPGYGTLSVTTSPPGALVYIDGSMKGITPATIPMLTAGPHQIQLVLDGYQDMKTTIQVGDGTTSEYITGLTKAQKTPGFSAAASVLSAGLLLFVLRKR